MDPYLVEKMATFRARRAAEAKAEELDLQRRVTAVKTLLADHYEGTPVFQAMRDELRSKEHLQELLD